MNTVLCRWLVSEGGKSMTDAEIVLNRDYPWRGESDKTEAAERLARNSQSTTDLLRRVRGLLQTAMQDVQREDVSFAADQLLADITANLAEGNDGRYG